MHPASKIVLSSYSESIVLSIVSGEIIVISNRHFITALILGVTLMSLHPYKLYFVGFQQGEKGLPQIDVERRFFIRLAPSVHLPTVYPSLGYGINDVFGVACQADVARLLERRQTAYNGGQFHSVVGGFQLAAAQFLFVSVKTQYGAPSTFAGITGTSSVRKQFYKFHAVSSLFVEFTDFVLIIALILWEGNR